MFQRIAVLIMMSLLSGGAFALYDSKPVADLAALQGEWTGELNYLDYGGSGKRVSLPTTLFVALAAPSQLVLHFVFDDGPGKTVYSYEQMSFDFGRKTLLWKTGAAERTAEQLVIVANVHDGNRWRVVFENTSKQEPHRFTLEVGPGELSFRKEELADGRPATLRNTYTLHRAASGSPASSDIQ